MDQEQLSCLSQNCDYNQLFSFFIIGSIYLEEWNKT